VAAAARVRRGSTKGRRILVVDDHRDAAESLAMLLRLHGHEVKEVYDGFEALAAAAEFDAEVIFLDIGLPGMDGYEVAKRIRQETRLRSARLIALSGYGSEEHRQQCLSVGFDGLLVKPVQLTTLESVLTASAPAFEREQA
jgi:two-component system CheB/CheR fusion protein